MSNNDMNGLAKGLLIFGVILIIGLIGNGMDSKPKCIKFGCNSEQASGSSYCYLHKPYTGSSSYKSSGSSYSSGSTLKSTSYSSNNKSTSSSYNSKSYTTKKKVEMPACDHYEDYDDFMDDWDGCMPDGSDAEDYWENW